MKIATDIQLEYIKSNFKEIVAERVRNYIYEGNNFSVFENLIVFYDNILFDEIRKINNGTTCLSMPQCNRVWNKLFWYLRYQSDIKTNSVKVDNHIQPISKILEELYNTCGEMNDLDIEPFYDFASNFEKLEYIMFDYFYPVISENEMSNHLSTYFTEMLNTIFDILKIKNINTDELENNIWNNIDNDKGEIITYRNIEDENIFISIDTVTYSEDQIHPVDFVIQCKYSDKDTIDSELVKLGEKWWTKSGPFVSMSIINKFDRETRFVNRKKIEK